MIIAGAGGAAHLPGMLAAVTTLPVIGVPVPLHHLGGVDSPLSIVQMPAGVPVATVAIGAARNAALLAARILAIGDPAVDDALDALDVFLAARAAASRDRDPGGAMAGGPSRPRSAPLRRGGAAPSAASGRRVRRPQGCGP